MQHYLAIRVAHQNQESKRSIARRLHHSQSTVARAVASPTGRPEPYRRRTPAVYPKLGPFLERIEAILKEDESAPLKQRHTAMQIYRRLVEQEGYHGRYDQVRRFVNKHRRDQRQTLVPLNHLPAERMECDFGQIAVDYPQGRQTTDVLIVTWSFSHALFMIATPNQRTESVLHGMVAAFEFFACVAREVWWDNPKTIATAVLRGRERVLNEDYAALASHYRFDPCACMPAKGQEKPDAESGVKALQRRACTPVPQVKDTSELNHYLRRFCLQERDRTVRGQRQTIGQRFELERPEAIPLPAHRFDPCLSSPVLIDKYQTATFEHNRYSVPRGSAFLPATVKAYVDRVEIVQKEQVVARHARSYQKDQWIVDPLHYVAALSVRPHALDHSHVFRDWKLPALFGPLRQRLEREHGPNAGIRQYIRVLQLLATHSAPRLNEAIRRLWHRVHLRSEHIAAKADEIANGTDSGLRGSEEGGVAEDRPLGDRSPDRSSGLGIDSGAVKNGGTIGAPSAPPEWNGGAEAPALSPRVRVPRPDLRRFNQLLPSFQKGTPDHERPCNQRGVPQPAVATQPQGAEAAHDAGRA